MRRRPKLEHKPCQNTVSKMFCAVGWMLESGGGDAAFCLRHLGSVSLVCGCINAPGLPVFRAGFWPDSVRFCQAFGVVSGQWVLCYFEFALMRHAGLVFLFLLSFPFLTAYNQPTKGAFQIGGHCLE